MRSFFIIAAAAALFPMAAASAQGLAAVGPLNPNHGFPEWYEDSNGLRMAGCSEDVGLCLLEAPLELLDPTLPFPANYGGDFAHHLYYNVCGAEMQSGGNGGLAMIVISLQGGFANEDEAARDGEQDVFARFRIRIDNLVAGETYEVTTPAGTVSLIAEDTGTGRRMINFTDDVGRFEAAIFGTELNGAIGPWLTWDSDLPIVDVRGNEYVGDPAIPHTITGSPFGTNVFRVRGRNVGGPGVHRIETNLFSIIGLMTDNVVDPPPPPPTSTFELAVAPAAAGALNTLTATGGTEGGLVAFLFGFSSGPRTINPAPCPMGVGLDILDPRLLGLNRTMAGSASVSLNIPPILAGQTLHMQAVNITTCEASPLVSATL